MTVAAASPVVVLHDGQLAEDRSDEETGGSGT
jgi:hypothetical protein